MRALWMLGAVLGLGGCSLIAVEGNGVAAEESRDVGGFSRVSVEGAIDVHIAEGPTAAVTVTCDENLIPYIQTTTDGDTLHIYEQDPDKKRLSMVNLRPQTTCKVDAVAPSLAGISLSGASEVLVGQVQGQSGTLVDTDETDSAALAPLAALEEVNLSGSGGVTVRPMVTHDIDLSMSGSGDITLAGVEANTVDIHFSGSGSVSVNGGQAAVLDASMSGSGEIRTRPLSAAAVSFSLSGSGDSEVTATSSVEVSLSGSGDLTVYGNPTDRDVSVTGSGDVTYE